MSSAYDLRDFLVTIFRNRYIQSQVLLTFKPLFQDERIRPVLSAIFLLHYVGEEGDPAFLRSVTGLDAYAEMSKVKEWAGEILRLEDDEFQIRSAVFAEFVFQQLLLPEQIIDTAYRLVIGAANRKCERRYRMIMGTMMQFSTLTRLLLSCPTRADAIEDLYERLRDHQVIIDEPLFWLQYMILMIEKDNLRVAEEFMGTAYARAESIGFRTFQIDTQACRLLLLLEARDTSAAVQRFDELLEKLELIVGMISDESHRYHAIRVLEGIPPFVDARLGALSVGERNALVYWIARLVDALGALPAEVRAQTGSDLISRELSGASERLVRSRTG